MTTDVRELYANVAVHATADREHEAVLELLLLVMLADRHISDAEIEEIRRISDESGWESDTFSFDQHFGAAVAKVRAAIADDTVEALLDDIDARITSSVLRHSLFSAARDVAGSDDEVDEAEDTLLGQLAARFA